MRSLIICLLIVGICYSQEHQVGVQRSIKKIDYNFSSDNVYHKVTGKKMNSEEVEKLILENPDLPLETIYDKKGAVLHYVYDPDNMDGHISRNKDGKTQPGEIFPDFVFKTTEGETIKSKELRGKWIVLRFEAFATEHFKKYEVLELDQKINNLEDKTRVVALIVFTESKSIAKKLLPDSDNFYIIPNGFNFEKKFKISRFPRTLVIDPEGVLIDYYGYSEDIEFDVLMKDD